MSVAVSWLIAGAIFLTLEAFGIPGIGFLFAGLAALLTGILVHLGVLGAMQYTMQAATFLIGTVLLAALLWSTLKRWRMNQSAPRYKNMIGDEAVVVTGITQGVTGTVRWSGTVMKAKMANGTVAELPEGTLVVITAVDGNVLSVAPKA